MPQTPRVLKRTKRALDILKGWYFKYKKAHLWIKISRLVLIRFHLHPLVLLKVQVLIKLKQFKFLHSVLLFDLF